MNSLQKNRAWIELDLSCLKNNIDILKNINNNIIAVVKANAYGHGAIEAHPGGQGQAISALCLLLH